MPSWSCARPCSNQPARLARPFAASAGTPERQERITLRHRVSSAAAPCGGCDGYGRRHVLRPAAGRERRYVRGVQRASLSARAPPRCRPDRRKRRELAVPSPPAGQAVEQRGDQHHRRRPRRPRAPRRDARAFQLPARRGVLRGRPPGHASSPASSAASLTRPAAPRLSTGADRSARGAPRCSHPVLGARARSTGSHEPPLKLLVASLRAGSHNPARPALTQRLQILKALHLMAEGRVPHVLAVEPPLRRRAMLEQGYPFWLPASGRRLTFGGWPVMSGVWSSAAPGGTCPYSM